MADPKVVKKADMLVLKLVAEWAVPWVVN